MQFSVLFQTTQSTRNPKSNRQYLNNELDRYLPKIFNSRHNSYHQVKITIAINTDFPFCTDKNC